MNRVVRVGLAAVLMLLAGCEKYRAKPLESERLFADVERRRSLLAAAGADAGAPPATPEPFTFARAANLMKTHSPALQEVQAEFQTAQAVAKIKTPLPNPGVEFGPSYSFGPDVGRKFRTQPFASIGFTIPTGKRLKRQDELNRASAELAWAEALIRHRELYLQLRKEFTRFALARQRVTVRGQIAESATKSSALTRKLIDAGFATALDVGLIELEQARLKTEALGAEGAVEDARGALSELIGVHGEAFALAAEKPLPELETELRSLADLKELLVHNHPVLARLRARYEVAERSLRLEIAKQYPDFHIGPGFDREGGEKKTTLGLTIGIELPIFDRNQQGVARAKQEREEIRTKYEAAANRALAVLERTHRGYQLANEKLALLKSTVLPRASANIDQARKALDAGISDSVKFLETERGQRAVLLDALETELSVREAWIALEEAVGCPLALFPGEDALRQPPAAGTPDAPSDSSSSKEVSQ